MPSIGKDKPTRLSGFRIHDRQILVNVESGMCYDATALPADLVDSYLSGGPEAALARCDGQTVNGHAAHDIIRTLQHMEQRGVAVAQQIGERAKTARQAGGFDPYSFTLFVSNRCNLACKYCFGDNAYLARSADHADAACPVWQGPTWNTSVGETSEYALDETDHGIMTESTASRAIDFMLNARAVRAQRRLGLALFGGEPLLAFERVRFLVEETKRRAAERGLELQFEFHVTTNGTILSKEHIAFLKKHRFSLIVSLDGPPEIHNVSRPYLGGAASQARVLESIRRLRAAGLPVTARATFVPGDGDFERIGRYFVEQGLDNFSIEPAFHRVDHIAPEVYAPLLESLHRWARTYVEVVQERAINFFYFTAFLRRIHKPNVMKFSCGSGVGYVAIGADGVLWPCHLFVGVKGWGLGNVAIGHARPDLAQIFARLNSDTREQCSDCWARHLCGGYCYEPRPAARYDASLPYPRPMQAHCQLMQDLIRTTAWVYLELRDRCPEALERILPLSVGGDQRS